jgi:hypothetical protein
MRRSQVEALHNDRTPVDVSTWEANSPIFQFYPHGKKALKISFSPSVLNSDSNKFQDSCDGGEQYLFSIVLTFKLSAVANSSR